MGLQLSTKRQAFAQTYDNSPPQGNTDIELPNVSGTIYDSLQRGDSDEHTYGVAGAAASENTGKVRPSSEVTLSRQVIVLIVVGMILISMVISIISGVVVYHVTNGNMARMDQEMTTGTSDTIIQTLQETVQGLQETVLGLQKTVQGLQETVMELQKKHNSSGTSSWSSWGQWGACSVTCGTGQQVRRRSCTNPNPDVFFNHCIGNDMDTNTCALRHCPSTSSWSSWGQWGACSVTCGSGQQVRRRNCINTNPDVFTNHCIGNDMDTNTCVLRHCPNHQVAFAVNTPNGTLVGDNSPIFRYVDLNVGGAYNRSTGKFTCPIPGMYYFAVTLISKSGTRSYVYCDIRKNASSVARAYSYTGDLDSASTSVFVQLSVGDTVNLECYNWQYVLTSSFHTSFTGSLIREN